MGDVVMAQPPITIIDDTIQADGRHSIHARVGEQPVFLLVDPGTDVEAELRVVREGRQACTGGRRPGRPVECQRRGDGLMPILASSIVEDRARSLTQERH